MLPSTCSGKPAGPCCAAPYAPRSPPLDGLGLAAKHISVPPSFPCQAAENCTCLPLLETGGKETSVKSTLTAHSTLGLAKITKYVDFPSPKWFHHGNPLAKPSFNIAVYVSTSGSGDAVRGTVC